MSRKKKVWVGFGVFMLLLGIVYIDTSVYPFTSDKPNFADVERVFNRMQFPSEWQEIRSSENRGIAGRQCPLEPSTACFHKGKSFDVGADITHSQIESLLKQAGCDSVHTETHKPVGAGVYTNFACSSQGLDISATLYERSDKWELSITIYS